MSTRGLTAAALLAVGTLLAGGAWAAGAGEGSAGPPGPAQVVYLEGEVLMDGQEVAVGQEVALGATVRTGLGAYCEIVFGGQNIFRIQADSVAVIDVEAGRGAITLQQGGLAAVFHKLQRLGAGDAAVRLRTPTAVAGVRGTAFFIQVESPTSTYVCTCNGALGLSDAQDGNRRQVRSDSHKAYRFAMNAAGIRVGPAGLLYHNNATMDLLAAKIRVRIPWGEEKDSRGY